MIRNRRCISSEIWEGDGFIDLPATAKALYAYLTLSCDDEGFTASISKCKIFASATDDDLNLLKEKRFIYILGDENKKVVVIKHWRASNYIKSPLPSEFMEADKVYVKSNNNYTLEAEGNKPLHNKGSDRAKNSAHTIARKDIARNNSDNSQQFSTILNNSQNNNSSTSKDIGSNHSEGELDCDVEDLMREMEEEEKKKNDNQ